MRDTIRIPRPPGHPSRELTWDDLEHKFRDCAAQAGTSAGNTGSAIAALRTLETQASVAGLVNLLLR